MFLCWFKHLKNFADMMSWNITTEEYIQRAKAVHGDKYGYELTEYVDRNTFITIICKTHGPFKIHPYTHIRLGCGCSACANDKKKDKFALTSESFIERAKEYIGSHYDYSRVEYVNAHTPVIIGCPIHGWFTKYPMEIQQGKKGCPECGKTRASLKRRTGLQSFIERSNIVHQHKFNYDKVIYVNQHTPVTITCPIHGDFQQRPQDHLRGHDCPKCSVPYRNGRSKNDLLKDFKEKHLGKYSYPNLPDWSNNRMYIDIICPIHGLFRQRIANHLRGDGCPSCRNSKQENVLEGHLVKKNIRFIREQTFPWLVRKGHMYIDFYLPEYNVAIECHGAQHFGIEVPNRFRFSEEDYRDMRERDELKYKLCKEHGIRLLYFCYYKKWVPDNYIDHVYTTVKELLAELKRIKN